MGKSVQYRAERTRLMVEVLETGKRPTDFEEAFSFCQVGCGQYKHEAFALWRAIKEADPINLAEVGRHMAGTSVLMVCAATNVKKFTSIDIVRYEPIDAALEKWLKVQGVEGQVLGQDSTKYVPDSPYDMVYIDGGHDGPTVAGDIAVWKDVVKFIGFHDFGDLGRKNKHKVHYPDLIQHVKDAWAANNWTQTSMPRGRSEIFFKTGK